MLGSGWMKAIPGFHPAGRLRRSSFIPDETVKSTHSHHLFSVLINHRSLITFYTDPKLVLNAGAGWMKAIPGFHPAGRLWRSSFVPDETVKSTHSHHIFI